MAIAEKLREWEAAGLIDAATAARIRAHEQGAGAARAAARPAPPLALLAIVGLGLLALVLGVLLLVAANWDRIPDFAKLGVHLLLSVSAAAALWRALPRGGWPAEAWLLGLGALVAGGIALQIQVYHLAPPLWQPLAAWLALMAPLLFLGGATRLSGHVFALAFMATLSALAFAHRADGGPWLLVHGLWLAAPLTLLLLSAAPGLAGGAFLAALGDAGIIALTAGASIAHFAWAGRLGAAAAHEWAVRLVVPAVVALAVVAAGRAWRRVPAPLLLPLALGPLLAVAAALAIPHGDGWPPRLCGFLLFALMWGWIARGAVRAANTPLFAVAIAALGVRLFIVYIELFGSLAATGGGMVAGGLLLIGLGFGWHRLTRRFARRRAA